VFHLALNRGNEEETKELLKEHHAFDFIFAADVIYEIELTERLVASLTALATMDVTTVGKIFNINEHYLLE